MKLEALSPSGAPFGSSFLVVEMDEAGFKITENSDFGCVLCTAAVDALEVIPVMAEKMGVEFPSEPGLVRPLDGRSVIWLSPRSWLYLCPLEDEIKLAHSINALFPDHRMHASIFSDYLCWFSLSGETAEDVLRQGGFLSLSRDGLAEGHAKQTLVAGIQAVLHRVEPTVWNIGIERSHAVYFMDWLRSCSFRR